MLGLIRMSGEGESSAASEIVAAAAAHNAAKEEHTAAGGAGEPITPPPDNAAAGVSGTSQVEEDEGRGEQADTEPQHDQGETESPMAEDDTALRERTRQVAEASFDQRLGEVTNKVDTRVKNKKGGATPAEA